MEAIPSLAERVAEFYWWHSIDLGQGIVTPGMKTPAVMSLEEGLVFGDANLAGKTLLDVGAWNGGFSVAAARRGARVTALDHFAGTASNFRGRETLDLVIRATGLDIAVVDRDVDAVALDDLGSFDWVLFLGVFYHLPAPVSVLRKVANLAKETLVVETYVDDALGEKPAMRFYPGNELNNDESNWWGPNTACMMALLEMIGFSRIEVAPGCAGDRRIFRAQR
jgi:tRNA (mo5U34)-methyltransferase